SRYRQLSEAEVRLYANQVNEMLNSHAGKTPHYSLRHFQHSISASLVWKPLSKEFWLDTTPARVRQVQLFYWVQEQGHKLTLDKVAAIATCDWYGPVRFMLPFALKEAVVGRHNTLVRGNLGIAARPTVAGTQVDFLVGRLPDKNNKPTAIDIVKPKRWEGERHQRRRKHTESVLAEAGCLYLPVDVDKAAAE